MRCMLSRMILIKGDFDLGSFPAINNSLLSLKVTKLMTSRDYELNVIVFLKLGLW